MAHTTFAKATAPVRDRPRTAHWAALFAASQGQIRQYVIGQDPPAGAFDPFPFAAESFEYVDCLRF